MNNSNQGLSQPLGEYLRQLGLLSDVQVRIVLYEQQRVPGSRFGELVLKKGWIDQRTLDRCLQQQCRSKLKSLLEKRSPQLLHDEV